MTKGDETRQRILHRAAEVFNRQGFSGASLSDIMQATGLEKGGIYNHFGSKEQLALEAFDYATGLYKEALQANLKGKRHAIDRLVVVIDIYRSILDGFPVPGGCPVMNTAIEADDTHPALRERARTAMNDWREFIIYTIQGGIDRGQLRTDVDPAAVASFIMAALEGAVMLSRLYADNSHMNAVVTMLGHYLDTQIRA